MALPLPSVVADVGAGGGIVTGRRGVNALRKEDLENQYYAPTAAANALSKTAYAQFAPAEAANNFLKAGGGQYLTREQNQALAQQVQSSLANNPMNQIMQGFQQKPNMLQMFYDKIKSLGGEGNDGSNEQPQNAMQQIPQSQGRNRFDTSTISPDVLNKINQLQPGQSYQISQGGGQPSGTGGGFATPASQQAADQQIPGTQGGLNAQTAAEVQKQNELKAAEGQTANATKQWDHLETQASNEQAIGSTLSKNAELFNASYDKSKLKGNFGGLVPSTGIPFADMSNEQIADTAAKNMQAALSPLIAGGGHISDSARDLAEKLKVNRSLDQGAKEALTQSVMALSERMQKKTPFFNQLRRNNPDILPTEANDLWNSYYNQFPAFDNDKMKPLFKNNNKWKEFTSKEAVNQYRQNGEFNAPGAEKHYYSEKFGRVTQADIDKTAKENNMTPEAVMAKLGINNG